MSLTTYDIKEIREIIRDELNIRDRDLYQYHIEPLKKRVLELETIIKAIRPDLIYKEPTAKDTAKYIILEMLKDGINRNKDMLERFKGSNKVFYEAMNDLINRGVVKKHKEGKKVWYEIIINE